MRNCDRCDENIKNGEGLGNRIKSVGKEKRNEWIIRHIKQLFSLVFHGFAKPEIEGYLELCDECFVNFQEWLDNPKGS